MSLKRQRAFLTSTQQIKRPKTQHVVIDKPMPKLNASQRLQVARMVKKTEETKYFYTQTAGIGVSNVATITSLAEIAVGDTDNDRIANDVTLKGLKANLTLLASDATQILRLLIFKWKENDNFNAPTVAQLIEPGPTGAPDVWSLHTTHSKKSVVWLYDELFVFSAGGSASNIIQKRQLSIPIKGTMEFYNQVNTRGTDKIYFLVISDSSAVTHPTMFASWELAYTDS